MTLHTEGLTETAGQGDTSIFRVHERDADYARPRRPSSSRRSVTLLSSPTPPAPVGAVSLRLNALLSLSAKRIRRSDPAALGHRLTASAN